MRKLDTICLVHHLLSQSRESLAASLLSGLAGDGDPCDREMAYVQVWCAACGNQWEEVIRRVCAPPFVADGETAPSWLTTGSLRRRRPGALLLLGNLATTLGYRAEAVAHYEQALRLLSERRMNVAAVRIRVHAALGDRFQASGELAEAVVHYRTALDLLDHCHVLYPSLCLGLCRAYAGLNLWSQAQGFGLLALLDLTGAEKAALLLTLSDTYGKQGDLVRARSLVEQAMPLAQGEPNREAEVFLQRARIEVAAGQRLLALFAATQAWQLSQQSPDGGLCAKAALLCAQINEALFAQTREPIDAAAALDWLSLAEAALSPAPESEGVRAEMAGARARLYEATGDLSEALATWKQAYEIQADRQVTTPMGGFR
jgi:tetratricopeptide (TPR) repeat protein